MPVSKHSRHADADGTVVVVGNRLGASIGKEELGRLFDRFYRGDAARSEFTESSGLGLSIVQAIMRLHGGSVSAECTEEEWIEFRLGSARVIVFFVNREASTSANFDGIENWRFEFSFFDSISKLFCGEIEVPARKHLQTR